MSNPVRKKLVIVGDGACGKTSLLIRFCRDEFNENYVPTVFETYVADITFRNKTIEFSLWDTAGQEDYDRLRPLSYPDTDIFLLCFAIDSLDSLENITEKWLPEIRHYCPSVPIVMAGLKKDVRSSANSQQWITDGKSKLVTPEQGLYVSQMIHANNYCECSARTCEGVREVFEKCVEAALQASKQRTKRRTRCTLL
ncbi:unnamed protein product [Enterobius vermicularis]|uniref:Ras-like GTP-binding protein Rho1 n=1 Tax=Enterobius vermicularis TaxID=51028 RepID=A0A0N4VI60_ENTVE|nr:unnamed protein product [Enterobius vermicularis]